MQSFIRRKKDRQERKAGLTLIEIGIVIAVFALILIGILTALGVANQSRELTGLSGDLSNIRSAITKWSAGGPVNILGQVVTSGGSTVTVNVGLKNFSQLAALLPAPLKLAAGGAKATLSGINPWGGNYVLSTSSTTPWEYEIRITGIEAGLAPIIANQLRRGDGDINPSNPTQMTATLTVTYEN